MGSRTRPPHHSCSAIATVPLWRACRRSGGGTLGNTGPSVTNAGITAGSPVAPIPISETQSATFLNTFNHPFNVEALYRSEADSDTAPLQYTNRDLYHRFYENQMQIDGGKNDKFAAWADSGGLTMGYFVRKPGDLPLWSWAKEYVLADNFFQSAFGGSYLNHQYLICSCAPIYPSSGGVPVNPAAGGTAPIPSAVNADGVTLTTAPASPASAIDGPPVYVNSSTLTPGPVFYSINTMQPPYPPSGNAATSTPPQQSVTLTSASTMPPQTQTTIGDLLDAAGVQWAWYAGALSYALGNPPFVNQRHHKRSEFPISPQSVQLLHQIRPGGKPRVSREASSRWRPERRNLSQ